MKTTNLFSRISKFGAAIACFLVAAAIGGTGCSQGSEGDRCNPDFAAGEGECGAGLHCLQPQFCPESYCCPVSASGDPTASRNANCQKGCNGGAASICNSGQDDGSACAFACKNDRSDLVSSSVCAVDSGAGTPQDAGAGAKDASNDGSRAD